MGVFNDASASIRRAASSPTGIPGVRRRSDDFIANGRADRARPFAFNALRTP